ncbi:MAG: preprotein translocase subunit SecE [Lachnospiraceae bacterium]|nr:preprotein translocase subunit SecE [Lachnospiraceae bacterium]MBR3683823.1 preprotein translocase subunit SecE [Lachnospiraceae bacterium]
MGDTEKTQKVGFFKGIKQEFKKITWLDKTAMLKQSVAVVGISVVVGAIIVLLDTVIQFGLKYLTM